MRRARIAIVLFAAALGIASAAFAAGPPVGPVVNPPRTSGITPAPSLHLPPPSSPIWLKNITINPGKAPTTPAFGRINGPCYWNNGECFIYGGALGKHDGLGRAPTGYALVATDITTPTKLGAPFPLTVTAWNGDLVAFKGFPHGGTYNVALQTTAGKTLTSLHVVAHTLPPIPMNGSTIALTPAQINAQFDEDHDGTISIFGGGTDCDDTNPNVHPGAPEVADPNDLDEDCDPSTFGRVDVDGDTHVSANACNLRIYGTGADRAFGFTCGDDCNDQRNSIVPGTMFCDPNNLKLIFLCNGGSGGSVTLLSPDDPRGVTSTFVEAAECSNWAGPTGHCQIQPNYTGVCVP